MYWCLWLIYSGLIGCNEWEKEKRHECTNMGKVKRLDLWWQLYITSLPERNVRSIRPLDFCWTECTSSNWQYRRVRSKCWPVGVLRGFWKFAKSTVMSKFATVTPERIYTAQTWATQGNPKLHKNPPMAYIKIQLNPIHTLACSFAYGPFGS
jgi:hypothetical protein